MNNFLRASDLSLNLSGIADLFYCATAAHFAVHQQSYTDRDAMKAAFSNGYHSMKSLSSAFSVLNPNALANDVIKSAESMTALFTDTPRAFSALPHLSDAVAAILEAASTTEKAGAVIGVVKIVTQPSYDEADVDKLKNNFSNIISKMEGAVAEKLNTAIANLYSVFTLRPSDSNTSQTNSNAAQGTIVSI